MKTRGFNELERGLLGLGEQVRARLRTGMTAATTPLQDEIDGRADDKIIGMSGATKGSAIAYAATDVDDGADWFQSAYEVASGLLEGFTGHDGQPADEAAQIAPDAATYYVIGTVPTTYQIKLEREQAGAKAFLQDAGYAAAPAVFEAALVPVKGLLGG
mgnify:CR=1 FL=1